MVGVGVAAARVRRQVVGAVRDAVPVDVGQTGLLAVAAGEPAEEVVEGAVLHHHHDDVVDAGRVGVGDRRRRCGGVQQSGGRGAAQGGSGAEQRGGLEELTSVQGHTRATSGRPRG
jgi:hypothetical protein